MLVFIAIVAIGFLVLIHEYGHFLVARLFGMRVDNFSIGFGPALLSWRGKQTEYRLSLLPLGGYVRIAGMAPGDGTPEDDPDSFANKPAWQRFLVILAGPLVNWLFAFLVLAALMMAGLPQSSGEPVIGKVTDGSAAARAGLQPGDRVVVIDGQPIATWTEMTQAIRSHRGQPMPMRLERSGERLQLTPIIGDDGLLGVAPTVTLVRTPFPGALGAAFLKTGEIMRETLVSLGQLIRGSKGAQLMGPVGIVSETVDAVRTSPSSLFSIMVLISLALAFMNLLPLPALDGGRLFFIAVAMVRRRPVNARVEAIVHAVGLLLLLGLLLYATWGDIGRALERRTSGLRGGGAPDSGQSPDAGR